MERYTVSTAHHTHTHTRICTHTHTHAYAACESIKRTLCLQAHATCESSVQSCSVVWGDS